MPAPEESARQQIEEALSLDGWAVPSRPDSPTGATKNKLR